MADDIAGLPVWEIEFDKDGGVTSDGGIADDARFAGVQNLFVFSHGWNNSAGSARGLYQSLFTLIAGQLSAAQKQSVGFAGIIWPSLLFPEDGPTDDGAPAGPTTSTGAQLAAALAPSFPDQSADLVKMGTLLDQQPEEGDRLDEFHALAKGLVTSPESGGPEDNGEHALCTASANDAITAMSAMPGTAVGDAQALNPFTAAWHGARELLRTMSYYEMKNRAGVVGKNGLGSLLARLQQAHQGLRVHLMGHSFGARLVSYSLAGLPTAAVGQASPVKSLYLVQGAFSHYTFSPTYPGSLKDFASRVDGPLLATFSEHDRAVGLWYPSASFLQRQDNQALFDFNKRWGAMGHDGYQDSSAQPRTLGPANCDYAFAKSGFYALDANSVIANSLSAFSGAHSDIRHPEVTWAAISAAAF